MQHSKLPRISIIVPTYNEEKDIRATLDALIRLNYPNKEIIVVDDSTDRTPEVIREYKSYGVQLLTQPTKEGRSGARNWGILNATGDIVVVLNADVHLPPDFLQRLVPHYLAGADYVLVESKVANLESIYARFVEAEGRFYYGATDTIEWTEGFSCRRAALLDVGLFPVGLAVPMCAGEDGFVGKKLHARGYKKVIDRSIIVPHVAPATLAEYWPQQVGRGKGISQVKVLLHGMRLDLAFLRIALKSVWVGLQLLLILPLALKAWQISLHSSRRKQDFLPFLGIAYIQIGAYLIGEWQALLKIARVTGGYE